MPQMLVTIVLIMRMTMDNVDDDNDVDGHDDYK